MTERLPGNLLSQSQGSSKKIFGRWCFLSSLFFLSFFLPSFFLSFYRSLSFSANRPNAARGLEERFASASKRCSISVEQKNPETEARVFFWILPDKILFRGCFNTQNAPPLVTALVSQMPGIQQQAAIDERNR